MGESAFQRKIREIEAATSAVEEGCDYQEVMETGDWSKKYKMYIFGAIPLVIGFILYYMKFSIVTVDTEEGRKVHKPRLVKWTLGLSAVVAGIIYYQWYVKCRALN